MEIERFEDLQAEFMRRVSQEPLKADFVDCLAAWVDDVTEKQRIWELHKTLPPPLGFDPEPHYGSIHHHYYGLLRFTPWRIELGDLYGEPIIWRPGTNQRMTQ